MSLLEHLDECKRVELIELINSFPDSVTVFWRTCWSYWTWHWLYDWPIKHPFYPASTGTREELEGSAILLSNMCCTSLSNSSWASPCRLAKKKPDSTFTPCTDFRKVNNVTKPDVFLCHAWKTGSCFSVRTMSRIRISLENTYQKTFTIIIHTSAFWPVTCNVNV